MVRVSQGAWRADIGQTDGTNEPKVIAISGAEIGLVGRAVGLVVLFCSMVVLGGDFVGVVKRDATLHPHCSPCSIKLSLTRKVPLIPDDAEWHNDN
jgi:hypothetical protein